jgi:5'-nucleotidase
VWQSQAADWQAAKEAVHRVLEWHTTVQKPKGTLFNVNIPPPPLCNPLSLRITHLGKVRYKPEVVQRQDPKDRSYYWIGGHTPEYDQDPHSDCFAIQQKHVAITPLQLDLTDHSTLNQLKMRNL